MGQDSSFDCSRCCNSKDEPKIEISDVDDPNAIPKHPIKRKSQTTHASKASQVYFRDDVRFRNAHRRQTAKT